MPISTDFNELEKLKNKLEVIRCRKKLCQHNLSANKQLTSPTLLELLKDEKHLVELISEYVPHDWTPNPGGSTPAPAVALHCA